MAKYYDTHKRLKELIDDAKRPDEKIYAEVKEWLKQNPELLTCHGHLNTPKRGGGGLKISKGDFPPILTMAVQAGNHGAVRAIIEALNANRQTVLDFLRGDNRLQFDCPNDDPLYMMSQTEGGHFLPHYYAPDAQMLQLLHDNGYDVRTRRRQDVPGKSYYQILADLFGKAIEEKKSFDQVEMLFAKAVGLGIDPQQKEYKSLSNDPFVGLAEYIFQKCGEAEWVANAHTTTTPGQLTGHLLEFIAKQGVDCRNVIAIDLDNYVTSGSQSMSQKAQDQLRALVRVAPENYFKTARRKECARAACAGNAFPELFAKCAQADANAGNDNEVTEVLKYLSDFWKEQYRNVIATAPVTAARTTALPDTALLRYVRGDAISAPTKA